MKWIIYSFYVQLKTESPSLLYLENMVSFLVPSRLSLSSLSRLAFFFTDTFQKEVVR